MNVQISGGPNHHFVCQSAPASVNVLPAFSVVDFYQLQQRDHLNSFLGAVYRCQPFCWVML